MNYKIKFIIPIFIFIISCSPTKRKNETLELSVTLKPKDKAFSSIFKEANIIPLETTDESLITSIGRIIEHKDMYLILDDLISVVFCFNKNGDFMYKIDKNGNGPDEYYLIYEMLINKYSDILYLLSPMGFLYTYDLQGNFIRKNQLEIGGQQDMIFLDNNTIAYWTLGPGDHDKVTLFDIDKEEIVGSFWKDTDENFMSNLCIDVFYKYENNCFFSTQYSNEVYKFTKDTLVLSYKWDFGTDNLNLKPYISRVKEDLSLFPELVDSNEIPYFFYRQFQNKDYYYTILETWNIDKWRNVFYRKKDGKSFVFDTLNGAAKIKNTLIFTDDYMICVIPPSEAILYKDLLSESEYENISSLQEDDNLCLIKLTFK